MTITNPRATFGLNCRATPAKDGSSGTTQVGPNNETLTLTNTKQVSFTAVLVGSATDLVVDVSDLDNTGSTAWTAGTAQVDTATAAGTITASGSATVGVVAAGMTGSPKTISVAVTNTDTAATWAGKVRTALAADSAVAAMFTVGGSTTAISLTRKATSTYTVNGVSVPVYPADDATLNISLDNGTCTGITTAASSTNTTAGVATAGCYVPDLDGTDFEGEPTGGLTSVDAVYIKNASTSPATALITQSTVLTDYPLTPGDVLQVAGTTGLLPTSDITVEPSATGDQSCLVTVTLAGA